MDLPRDWTFETAAIAAGFDRHVREQLPWYDLATAAVGHLVRHYLPRGGLVYDIGAATGNIGRALAATLAGRQARLVAIEASAGMAAAYAGPGELVQADALDVAFERYDVAVLFLTLMFLPVAQRGAFLGRLRAAVRPGGAIIVFDRGTAVRGYAATVLWRLALAGKVAAGVDPAEIVAKELSLGGVQRPVAPAELGPDAIEWFRFGEFAGWLIEAPAGGEAGP